MAQPGIHMHAQKVGKQLKRWTPQDLVALAELYRQRTPYKTIAKNLGRSEKSVRQKINKLCKDGTLERRDTSLRLRVPPDVMDRIAHAQEQSGLSVTQYWITAALKMAEDQNSG